MPGGNVLCLPGPGACVLLIRCEHMAMSRGPLLIGSVCLLLVVFPSRTPKPRIGIQGAALHSQQRRHAIRERDPGLYKEDFLSARRRTQPLHRVSRVPVFSQLIAAYFQLNATNY